MMDEPQGHRGHPSEAEVRRARKIAVYLERAIDRLQRQGFSEREAVTFVAGASFAKASQEGETWSKPENAIDTIERIRLGRGAKEWSEHAIILALFEIGDLLKEGNES